MPNQRKWRKFSVGLGSCKRGNSILAYRHTAHSNLCDTSDLQIQLAIVCYVLTVMDVILCSVHGKCRLLKFQTTLLVCTLLLIGTMEFDLYSPNITYNSSYDG